MRSKIFSSERQQESTNRKSGSNQSSLDDHEEMECREIPYLNLSASNTSDFLSSSLTGLRKVVTRLSQLQHNIDSP